MTRFRRPICLKKLCFLTYIRHTWKALWHHNAEKSSVFSNKAGCKKKSIKRSACCIALLLLAIDVWSKSYIHSHFPLKWGGYPYGGIGLFAHLFGMEGSIVHVTNTGAAFGMLSHMQLYLVIARMTVTGLLLYHFCKKKLSPLETLCFSLILAGAVGNLLDYFLYGHVVDMFYFKLWGLSCPVFNGADACIFCGVALLILSRLRQHILCA